MSVRCKIQFSRRLMQFDDSAASKSTKGKGKRKNDPFPVVPGKAAHVPADVAGSQTDAPTEDVPIPSWWRQENHMKIWQHSSPTLTNKLSFQKLCTSFGNLQLSRGRSPYKPQILTGFHVLNLRLNCEGALSYLRLICCIRTGWCKGHAQSNNEAFVAFPWGS
eukprot:4751801-Amphidinium_carterae.1